MVKNVAAGSLSAFFAKKIMKVRGALKKHTPGDPAKGSIDAASSNGKP